MKTNTRGILSLLISAAIYGSFGILIQWMNLEMTVINQIVFRYFLAILLVILVLMIARPRLKVPKEAFHKLFWYAIITQVSIWCFTQGAVLTSIPSLLGSFYIGSIVTGTMIGLTVFREKLSFKNWAGTFIAIFGLYVLSHNSTLNNGILFGLAAGSTECVTQAFRKYLRGVSRGVILMASLVGVFGVSLVSAQIGGQPFYPPLLPSTWIAGASFAVLVGIVNITVTYGFRLVSMNVGSVIMSAEILFGALFSKIFLSARITQAELVASLSVLVSIAVQNWIIKEDNKSVLLIRKVLEE